MSAVLERVTVPGHGRWHDHDELLVGGRHTGVLVVRVGRPEIVTVDPPVYDRAGIRQWDGVTRLGPVPGGDGTEAERVASVARRWRLV